MLQFVSMIMDVSKLFQQNGKVNKCKIMGTRVGVRAQGGGGKWKKNASIGRSWFSQQIEKN